jgi:cell division protein ZapA (FtsZ GTPase activity inhibitor)
MDDDNNATNNQIRFRANGDGAAGTIDIMTVDEVGGGRVGIGTTAPALLLHVGSATVTTGTSVARFENAGGTCTVTPNVAGGITCTSDVRFKKNIETIDDSLLNKLAGVQVRQYNMKVDADGTQKQIGFIAQNLETIFPSTVMTDEQGNKSVSYSALTPILTQAMQELNLKVDTNQTNTIATVTTLNTGLEAQSGSLTTLEQTLADNTAAIESLQQNVTSLEDRVAALENAGAVTTTTPPTDGIFTTLTTFMEDAVFNKVVTFKDMILVEGPAVFSDLVQFNDTVVFNKDAAGHATIASGDSKIDITFDKPYPSAPVVTVTPNEKVDALYYVTNVTASGFTIEMDPSATENVKFSWNAVATASATPAP